MKHNHGARVLGSFVLVAAAAAPCLAGGSDVRVVVGFKRSADADAVGRHGGQVVETHGGLKAVVANVPASKLAALRADASVAFVEEDGIAEATKDGARDEAKGGSSGPPSQPSQPSQTAQWGVKKVWSDTAPPTDAGKGVKLAVIDTGIDLSHPDLTVVGYVSFVARSNGNDDNGHGTHCAGIAGAGDNSIGVVGVAPNVSLYAVKVLDARGSGYWSAVAAGIDWARTNQMDVANMSLGGGYSEVVEDACDAAWNGGEGVLLIAAAGNGGDGSTATNEISYPAASASVVSVGSTTSSDGLSSFSNTNSDVEVSAPGSSIYSTYKGSSYATLSGTSMASPHAAGAAAALWSAAIAAAAADSSLPTPSASSVRSDLSSHVVDLGAAGDDNGFGAGRVDLDPASSN